MPFWVVSGVGRGRGVLHGVVIVEEEGIVLGVNVGRPIVKHGDLVAWLCESDAHFPNYFGEDLLCTLPVSVVLSSSDGVAISCVLSVLWMTTYFHIMAL